MKRFIFCIFSFLLFFNTIIIAQEVVWQKKMLQSSWTTGYSVKQASDGNYIVCGIYDSFNGFVTKINPKGDTIWFTICPANLRSIVESIDGYYIAIGWSSIIKISSSGEIKWFTPITEPLGDLKFNYITKGNDNNFVIAGMLEQANPRIDFGYVIKIDNNGDKIWSRRYTVNNTYIGLNNIKQLSDGNFITTGFIDLGGNEQVLIQKLNSFGEVIWQNNYGSATNEYGYSVFQLPDDCYLTIGTIWYSNQNIKLYFTKTDTNGNHIWSKIYGSTYPYFTLASPNCAVEDKNNNNYIITAINNISSILLAIDQNAEKVWERTYTIDSFQVYGYSVDICNDSGYIVFGDVFRPPSDLSNPQYLYALKTTKPKPIGIIYTINYIPLSIKLYQNYPNPFNNETLFKYEITKFTNANLIIYNILGEKLQTFINKSCSPGFYNFVFNSNNYSTGIYFVQISDDEGHADIKKMIIIK